MADPRGPVRMRLSVRFPDGREDAIDLEVEDWPMPADRFALIYLEPIFARWAEMVDRG